MATLGEPPIELGKPAPVRLSTKFLRLPEAPRGKNSKRRLASFRRLSTSLQASYIKRISQQGHIARQVRKQV